MGNCRHHGSHFEKHKTAFEEGGGDDDAYIEDEETDPEAQMRRADVKEEARAGGSSGEGSVRSENVNEKV